jgi:hypothetical protein
VDKPRVKPWPTITDERLLARLALDDAGFRDFLTAFLDAIGAREYGPAQLTRAYGYPWERPAGSYVLRDGDVTQLDALDAAARAEIVARYTRDRHPIVAIGSNGSPVALQARFGRFAESADRDVLVLTGKLHDLDIGVIPTVTLYGSMPAALFESPGTAVHASVVWLTTAQVTLLTWAEVGYRLGRIEATRFEVDGRDADVTSVFAYVARLGAFCPEPDRTPVALAAVAATGRTAPALTQEQLLDRVAPLLLGDGARAEDVVRAACTDLRTIGRRAREVLWSQGRPLPRPRVTLLPALSAAPANPVEAGRATLEALRDLVRGELLAE